jgi:hypothetical protein
MDFFAMQIASINRKQVSLCKSHHINLHGNKLTEAEIIVFKEGVENLSQFSQFYFFLLNLIASEPSDGKLSRWVLRAMETKLSVSLFSNEHHMSNLLIPTDLCGG